MKYKKTTFIISIFALFLFMLFLNFKTPYLADDYYYMLPNQNGFSLKAIFDFQKDYYFSWGGRVMAHFFAQIFLSLDKAIFNIVNSAMFVTLTVFIYKLAKKPNERYDVWLYYFIIALVWFFAPVFGQTTLWLVGSCNYLFGATFNIALIYFFKRYMFDRKALIAFSFRYLLFCLFIIVLAFISGAYNENTSTACLIIIVAMMIIKYLKKEKLPLFSFLGVVSMFLGVAFMILAPGNYVRNAELSEAVVINGLMTFLSRVGLSSYRLLDIAVLLLAVIAVILIKVEQKKYSDIKIPLLLMFGALLANYAMIMTNAYPERALFGACILVVSALAMLIKTIDIKRFKLAYIAASLSLTAFFMISVFFGTVDVVASYNLHEDRESDLAKATTGDFSQTIETYAIKPLTKYSALYGLEDIAFKYDTVNWVSTITAQRYQLASVHSAKIAYDNWGTAFIFLF